MKEKKNNIFVSSIILSVCFVIFGLLLLIFPKAIIDIIAYILAVGTAAIGIYGLYKFFIGKDESNYSKYGLAYGVLFVVLAFFIIFKKNDMIKILPYTIGAIILVGSTLKIDSIIQLKKENNENWKVTLTVTVICFLLGIILLFFPLEAQEVVVSIIGLVIVFYSILDIITSYIIKTNLEKDPTITIEVTTTSDETEKDDDKKDEAIENVAKDEVKISENKITKVKKETKPASKTAKKPATKKPAAKKTTTKNSTPKRSTVKKTQQEQKTVKKSIEK